MGVILDLLPWTKHSSWMRALSKRCFHRFRSETVVLMARSLAEHGRHVRGHGRDLGLIALDEAFLVDEGTIKEVLSPLQIGNRRPNGKKPSRARPPRSRAWA